MRSKKCDQKGCKEKAVGFFYGKRYCEKHQEFQRENNKYGKVIISKICKTNKCKKKLSNSNTCGMCQFHRDLKKNKIIKEKMIKSLLKRFKRLQRDVKR